MHNACTSRTSHLHFFLDLNLGLDLVLDLRTSTSIQPPSSIPPRQRFTAILSVTDDIDDIDDIDGTDGPDDPRLALPLLTIQRTAFVSLCHAASLQCILSHSTGTTYDADALCHPSSAHCASGQPILPPPDFLPRHTSNQTERTTTNHPPSNTWPGDSSLPLRADSQPVLSIVRNYPRTYIATTKGLATTDPADKCTGKQWQ
ncbi:hypothetical protein F5B22DRAFT_513942 [Xylaria bambusicola]|uniref:uncharacterized protein n=1 Tax=Xylaria bambusicola TaxID=326684 RepID=UPI0020075781|nr:uncharacterized protein F5B22DRAFT_513942 [Xylaria bambusicola]KAI0522018.1 hypothetical protein F5B22DRAFT_513942 [Xylaria bambusicola]